MEPENIVIQTEKKEVSAKLIGKDFKKFIQTNSNDYLERLKVEVLKGLRVYFDSLNTQFIEEQNNQEKQQKELEERCKNNLKGKNQINGILTRRQQILINEKIHRNETNLKLKAFMSLYKNKMEERENRKKLNLVENILTLNKKRKIFKALKEQNLFQRNKDYEDKLKKYTEDELQKLRNDLFNQKQQLLILINQAKEKLKHENRKKIQVKLMLDQMVLRGISALNMQAMKLSQDSLKDVVNCDYKKEIDAKYTKMLFPDSKTTLVNSLK